MRKTVHFSISSLFIILLLCIASSSVMHSATPLGRKDSLKIGEEAPPFVMRDLIADTAVFMRDFTGKTLRENWKNDKNRCIVVISFWATWCQPCKIEIPKLSLLADKYKGKPIKFFLVNTMERAEQTEDSVRTQYQQRGYTLPCLIDPGMRFAGTYTVRGLPMLVVIDKFGVVRKINRGYHENFDIELEELLNELLSNTPQAK
jgi:cytochrome c biogenesis protein CcmG, thiol:disulfide interchange protein DsbE